MMVTMMKLVILTMLTRRWTTSVGVLLPQKKNRDDVSGCCCWPYYDVLSLNYDDNYWHRSQRRIGKETVRSILWGSAGSSAQGKGAAGPGSGFDHDPWVGSSHYHRHDIRLSSFVVVVTAKSLYRYAMVVVESPFGSQSSRHLYHYHDSVWKCPEGAWTRPIGAVALASSPKKNKVKNEFKLK